ncbi:unnamed protein product [Rotaria magnacalcarata]
MSSTIINDRSLILLTQVCLLGYDVFASTVCQNRQELCAEINSTFETIEYAIKVGSCVNASGVTILP